MTGHIVPLDAGDAELETVGGKGCSLVRLVETGFPVPPGFVVASDAYRRFVADQGLENRILELARPAVVDGAESFEPASTEIRRLFETPDLPDGLVAAIERAYQGLAPERDPAVAVRSSANAEDLPEASFAGQQETYLNVRGTHAVAAAVKDCWASLWTPQAMNYRHEIGIDHGTVAMAVVVQVMVPADVSGILFTANPGTGERGEMIVNASFGLGEAVVGGHVTPDTFVIDRETLVPKETVLGAKALRVVPVADGGTLIEAVAAERQTAASLGEDRIAELAGLAVDVERTFDGVPQDIEWAFGSAAGDPAARFWILQSRPITNLPSPPPKDVTWPEIPGAQLLKRQVAENMPDPLSPLFEDLYLHALFDVQQWPEGWEWKGNKTRNWMKNFVIVTVNGYAYQPIYRASAGDWDKHMAKVHAGQAKRSRWANLKATFAMPEFMIADMKAAPLPDWMYLFARTLRTFRKYPAIIRWEREQLPAYLAIIDEWEDRNPGALPDVELLAGMKALTLAEARYWLALRSVIGTAKLTDGGFQRFLERNAPEGRFISGSFLSGFPSKTLEAEFALRAIAQVIRSDPTLTELLIVTPAPRLLDAIRQHPGAGSVREAIDAYLHDFGRQVFNLDFAEPALAEDPLPLAVSLKALVRDPGHDLATRQKEVARTRRRAFAAALRFFKGRRRLEFLRAYWTARINYPAREEALFHLGLAWSTFRPLALELGRRLVAGGTFDRSDDVFHVTGEDLARAIEAKANDLPLPELADTAAEQRGLRALRFRMDQPAAIPPVKHKGPLSTVVSNAEGEDVLRGFAVSPGTVTGTASVVLTPNDFGKMKPGSILVCPLTTPAWTQLFPQAIGLATDIGSILAHGSIVAREYGIPAVLGIGNVTQRVKSGQRIAVDGNRGTVTILDS
ncbi:MAG: PEP-utilizing enzyme [Gammaproteobacteria bacterium]|nr:PEP-utilizing enzyme [Gammaproteobacteria bacterium]